MKKLFLKMTSCILTIIFIFTAAAVSACAEETPEEEILAPLYPVYDYVEYLLETARGELGEGEDAHGNTKYGIWAGDPDAEWCAEFLCWCVDRVDQVYGTQLLKNVYPRYSSTNVGRDWFIRNGRYVSRKGNVPDWGSQWYIDSRQKVEKNSYIPQPGDWMFFSVYSSGDTSHVAMVEYTSRDQNGKINVHVIEGNNPDKVARNTYPIDNWAILGYGTVRRLTAVTLRPGNEGEPVRALQEQLVTLGYLQEQYITGKYANLTADAVRAYQREHGIQETGIAGQETQTSLENVVKQYYADHPEIWSVEE